MKLTTTTMLTVDGVMQGLGAPDEDPSGGFERGGWQAPLWDNEAGTFLNQVYERADAFLFGRRTYEIFAGSWGAWADPGDNPIWTALNFRPKYVASTTLTDPQWAETSVLSGEVAGAVGELKAKPGGELQVHGSGALIRSLLENDLVDEMNLFICPVVVGQGRRLFPDTGPDIALELVDSRSTPKGVTIQLYRPNGRPRYEGPTPEARDVDTSSRGRTTAASDGPRPVGPPAVPRLDSRRAGPAEAGERVGRISEGSIHPASGRDCPKSLMSEPNA